MSFPPYSKKIKAPKMCNSIINTDSMKKLLCNICDEVFMGNSNLVKHMREQEHFHILDVDNQNMHDSEKKSSKYDKVEMELEAMFGMTTDDNNLETMVKDKEILNYELNEKVENLKNNPPIQDYISNEKEEYFKDLIWKMFVKECDGNNQNLSKSSPSDKLFKCDICEKTFPLQFKLKMHIKKYHEIVNQEQPDALTKVFNENKVANNSDPLIYDKCEFCEKTFDTKNNLGLKKRHHIYSHHFYKEINSEIDWKPSGTVCPIKDCTFSARLKGNLINHYIGVTHGILDKYIDAKRKEILDNDKTSQLVSNNDISIHDLKTSTLTENADTNSEENSKKSNEKSQFQQSNLPTTFESDDNQSTIHNCKIHCVKADESCLKFLQEEREKVNMQDQLIILLNDVKSKHDDISGNSSDNISGTISENNSENSIVDVLDQILNVPQYLKIFRKYSKNGDVFYTFSFTKGG